MKKTFIVAIIVSAALVGACGKKKPPATVDNKDMGSAAGSDMGSAAGSDTTPPAGDGSGSAM